MLMHRHFRPSKVPFGDTCRSQAGSDYHPNPNPKVEGVPTATGDPKRTLTITLTLTLRWKGGWVEFAIVDPKRR